MIDTLFKNLDRARGSQVLNRLGLEPRQFCAMTLHRPSNVDDKEKLSGILDAIEAIGGRDYPLVLAGVVCSSALVVLGALFADLAVMSLDPRRARDV